MSLNASEQMVFDYLRSHPDEESFWRHKLRQLTADEADEHALSMAVAEALGEYYEERASVLADFRDDRATSGSGRRVSMRNLADHLIRLWTEPRRKQPSPVSEDA